MYKLPSLASVEEFKEYKGITKADADSDEKIQALLDAMSQYIRNYAGQDFTLTKYKEVASGFSSYSYQARVPFVRKVLSCSIGGRSIDVSNPVINNNIIYFDNVYLADGVNNIVLEYVAGYTDVPYDIKQACIQLAYMRLQDKGRIGELSKSQAGETTMFDNGAFPGWIKETLLNYRFWGFDGSVIDREPYDGEI